MLEPVASVVVRCGAALTLGTCLAAVALVAACGQKGPLLLSKPVPGATSVAPASSAAAAVAKP